MTTPAVQRRIGPVRRLGVGAVVIACAASCSYSGGDPTSSASDGSVAAASSAIRPVATTSAPDDSVPPLSAAASSAGFVDVRSVVRDAVIDLRYATTNNFTGTVLYPSGARCLVHESLAAGLSAAAAALRPQGQLLVFWDCYRPHDVQIRLFQVVSNPAWVARPGQYSRSHESGRSVDLTFAGVQQRCPPQRQLGGLCLADMGTDFDDFSARATAFATQGVSADAQANRAHLRAAMNAGGLTVYSGEWWHFDGPGADVDRPILNVPVN
ncbi:M15 family metallopeptidase [Mycobacterium basiliense]|uniref:M15 family metallopeptidase n=1 Tax=Mycobacterium basiliense TaxID=2094119 RepID=UPI0038CC0585